MLAALVESGDIMSQTPFLTRLHLKHFRSLRNVTVTFDNPLILVGKNGSGKSNFVDALAFLSECVQRPLSTLIQERGGVYALCTRGPAGYSPSYLKVRADFELPGKRMRHGHYAFFLATQTDADLSVMQEQCFIMEGGERVAWFHRDGKKFRASVEGFRPAFDAQSLALPIMGGLEEFAPAFKALASMRVYSFAPDRIRQQREPDGGKELKRDGSNVASVLLRHFNRNPGYLRRVGELLAPIVPGITTVLPRLQNNRIDLVLSQSVNVGEATQLDFDISEMSDGTIYALALIVATMQEPAPSLMVIEEPEAMIHPGAMDAIAEKIALAARRSQVIVTTHSTDLLDTKWIEAKHLRLVEWENGQTHISPLGSLPVRALQQHLMGAGELLRANALIAAPISPQEEIPELFDETPA